jgi:hypothetical protein
VGTPLVGTPWAAELLDEDELLDDELVGTPWEVELLDEDELLDDEDAGAAGVDELGPPPPLLLLRQSFRALHQWRIPKSLDSR